MTVTLTLTEKSGGYRHARVGWLDPQRVPRIADVIVDLEQAPMGTARHSTGRRYASWNVRWMGIARVHDSEIFGGGWQWFDKYQEACRRAAELTVAAVAAAEIEDAAGRTLRDDAVGTP